MKIGPIDFKITLTTEESSEERAIRLATFVQKKHTKDPERFLWLEQLEGEDLCSISKILVEAHCFDPVAYMLAYMPFRGDQFELKERLDNHYFIERLPQALLSKARFQSFIRVWRFFAKEEEREALLYAICKEVQKTHRFTDYDFYAICQQGMVFVGQTFLLEKSYEEVAHLICYMDPEERYIVLKSIEKVFKKFLEEENFQEVYKIVMIFKKEQLEEVQRIFMPLILNLAHKYIGQKEFFLALTLMEIDWVEIEHKESFMLLLNSLCERIRV